jgi:hypothetical protein
MSYTTAHFGLLNCTMAITGGSVPSLTTDGLSVSGLDETAPGCAELGSFRLRATAAAGNLSADTANAYFSDDGGATWYRFPAADLGIAGGAANEGLGDYTIAAPNATGRIAYASNGGASLTFTLYGVARRGGR